MPVAPSIFLPTANQQQLQALISANHTKLSALSSKAKAAEQGKSAVVSLSSQLQKVQSDLNQLRSSDPAAKVSALQSLVNDYNGLMQQLTDKTAKGAVLNSANDIHSSKTEARKPFLDLNVTAALKAAGVSVTQNGLSVTGTLSGAGDLSVVADAFATALGRVSTSFTYATQRFTNTADRISKDTARETSRVEKLDKVTTSKYLKMYQIMQAMQSATGASGTVSIFG